MGWDNNFFALMPYNSKWHAHRRMFQQQFYQAKVDQYKSIQLQHVRAFLSSVLQSSESIRKDIRQ